MVSFVSSGNPWIMIPDSEFSYWLCIETMWLLKKKSFKDNIWTLSDSIIVINSDMHFFFPCRWLLLCCSGWFEYWRQIAQLVEHLTREIQGARVWILIWPPLAIFNFPKSLPFSKNNFLITSTRLLRHWNWINMKNIIDFLIIKWTKNDEDIRLGSI